MIENRRDEVTLEGAPTDRPDGAFTILMFSTRKLDMLFVAVAETLKIVDNESKQTEASIVGA